MKNTKDVNNAQILIDSKLCRGQSAIAKKIMKKNSPKLLLLAFFFIR